MQGERSKRAYFIYIYTERLIVKIIEMMFNIFINLDQKKGRLRCPVWR